MVKIGNFSLSPIRFFSLLFGLLAIGITAHAQDFELEATVSENKIFIGEQFTLNIEVKGSSMRDVSLPVIPDVEGVRVLSNTPSRSSSISIINGRTTTSTTYSFGLIAREKGHFTIPPVSIKIDGEEYKTDPIDIEIIEKGQLSENGRRQLPDIFLEVKLDDKNPVAGQQIVASIVLYFKDGIEVTSFQPTAGWRTDGFWKEELENIRQPQAESVILEGVRYRSATLMRYALFPTRGGDLSLSEFPLNVGVRTQSSRNDPFGSFFGSTTNQRRMALESDPITVHINDLPAASSNSLSINAVGDISVGRTLSKENVKEGETVELTTRVHGTGNIPLVRRPEYNFPDNIEEYTPQENSSIERRGLTISGDKTFTELLAPRAPGSYKIPEERIAIYNPKSGSYRYEYLPALEFKVEPAVGMESRMVSSGVAQLQPITGLAVWSQSTTGSIFSKFWFWILLVIPAVALGVAIQKKHHLTKLSTDKKFARAQHAENIANERLKEARAIVNDGDAKAIYNVLHKALFGYLTDKLGLPQAGFSDEELLEEIKKSKIEQNQKNQIKKILEKCATISFAPTGNRTDFRSDIIKTEKLITELKEQL